MLLSEAQSNSGLSDSTHWSNFYKSLLKTRFVIFSLFSSHILVVSKRTTALFSFIPICYNKVISFTNSALWTFIVRPNSFILAFSLYSHFHFSAMKQYLSNGCNMFVKCRGNSNKWILSDKTRCSWIEIWVICLWNNNSIGWSLFLSANTSNQQANTLFFTNPFTVTHRTYSWRSCLPAIIFESFSLEK